MFTGWGGSAVNVSQGIPNPAHVRITSILRTELVFTDTPQARMVATFQPIVASLEPLALFV